MIAETELELTDYDLTEARRQIIEAAIGLLRKGRIARGPDGRFRPTTLGIQERGRPEDEISR
jgi:hypothetical protein